MAYQIKVSKDAEKDLRTAKFHFAISGLENEFDKDFLTHIDYLKGNPFLFQMYYRKVRRIHFRAFKYSIHYIIENEIVYILRILHHKQEDR